jgi:endonuclease III
LIQEDLRTGWQMLVACILLNRTQGETVRYVLRKLLNRYPTRHRMMHGSVLAIERLITPVGLQYHKARNLVAMSREYDHVEHIRTLRGIGNYGEHSWLIFVEGMTTFPKYQLPGMDSALKLFVEDVRAGRVELRRLKP